MPQHLIFYGRTCRTLRSVGGTGRQSGLKLHKGRRNVPLLWRMERWGWQCCCWVVRLCEGGTLRWLDGVPLDVGAPAVFIGDCFAAAAVLVGLDGFVEMSSAVPGTARATGVVLGDAGGPRVRFEITCKREEGFSC